MMFCNKCGAQLDDTAVFCGQCGNPISGGKQTGQKAMQPGARAVQRKTIYAIGALLAAVVVTGIIVAFGMRSISGGKQTGQKAMQPGARAVQRKTIYAIGALLAAVVVTGIIVAFGMRSAGKSEKSEEPELYGTSWAVENGSERGVFQFRDDGYLRALKEDGSHIGDMRFSFGADNTIKFGDDPVSFVYKYELSEDTLELVSVGHESYIFMNELFRNKIFLRETEARITLHRSQSASLYGSWRDSSGTVGIDIYEDGNIHIAGIEETQGVEEFKYSKITTNKLLLTAYLNEEPIGLVGDFERKVLSLTLRYVIDGNIMTVEIADHTFELEKVE